MIKPFPHLLLGLAGLSALFACAHPARSQTADATAEMRALGRCSGCVLQDRDFSGRRLTSLDLSDARLQDIAFDTAKLNLAIFENAILTRVSFEGADLSGANFAGARLNDVSFAGSNLRGAVFDNAQLSRSSLDHAYRCNTQTAGDSLDNTHCSETWDKFLARACPERFRAEGCRE